MSEADWIEVCASGDLAKDDVIGVDIGGQTVIVVRDEKGAVFAADGLCTHEAVSLAEGFVMDGRIICPKHGGEFDYRTGMAIAGPVCEHLRKWSALEREGKIWVRGSP